MSTAGEMLQNVWDVDAYITTRQHTLVYRWKNEASVVGCPWDQSRCLRAGSFMCEGSSCLEGCVRARLCETWEMATKDAKMATTSVKCMLQQWQYATRMPS